MKYTHLPTPDIPKLGLTNIGGKRHYTTPAGELISITSLLSSHTPDSVLNWRKNVGDNVANYVMRAAANRGKKVHKLIELSLSNAPAGGIQEYGVLATGLFNLMTPALEKINNIRVLETPLYSERLGVAGTVDAICDYENKLVVADFKTSSKIRSKDEITNYFIQCTFYAHAWEEMTGEKIQGIVIIMVSDDGNLAVFEDNPTKYNKKLQSIVEEFHDGKMQTL